MSCILKRQTIRDFVRRMGVQGGGRWSPDVQSSALWKGSRSLGLPSGTYQLLTLGWTLKPSVNEPGVSSPY